VKGRNWLGVKSTIVAIWAGIRLASKGRDIKS